MEKEKKKIYFAHPWDRLGTKREEMIIKKLEERGFEVINPFVGENKLEAKYGGMGYYDNPLRAFALDIKEKDFKQVIDCDAFFAWIPKDVTMIGTIREFDKALENGRYTIILCYRPNPFLEDADELYLSYQDFLEGKQFVWK